MMHTHSHGEPAPARTSRLLPAMLVALVAALLMVEAARAGPPTPFPSAQSPRVSSAADILAHLSQSIATISRFEQGLQIRRTTSLLAPLLLPPHFKQAVAASEASGRLSVQGPGLLELQVHWKESDTDVRFACPDGSTIEYALAPLAPLPRHSTRPETPASPPGNPTGRPADGGQTLRYRSHPLLLVWPLAFQPSVGHPERWRLADPESVNGHECWHLHLTSGAPRLEAWIDTRTFAVVQVRYPDAEDGQAITASYGPFYTLPGGFQAYRSMQVMKGGRVILDIPSAEEPTIVIGRTNWLSGSPAPSSQEEPEDTSATFSTPLLIFIGLVLLVLAWLGGLALNPLQARDSFSRTLLVAEEEEGWVGRFLTDQGYKVVRCTRRILEEESRGVASRFWKTRPHAIVVAPGGFASLKGCREFLQSYVRHGGRMLVLGQSSSSLTDLPFQATFLPCGPERRLILVARPDFFRRARPEEIEERGRGVTCQEVYGSINHRPQDQSIVRALERGSGMRLTIAGIVHLEKGEYVLCQLDLVSTLAALPRKAPLDLRAQILLDLIDYTQGCGQRLSGKETITPPA